MNIFLDTNILFEDYFFQNASNNKLLEYAKQGLLSLHMSEIVKLELRNQYERELEAKVAEIKKLKKRSDKLRIELNIREISIPDQLKIFDDFYSELNSLDNFSFIPYRDSFMTDITEMAVQRRKPFFENKKSELKDAIIWKSYSTYVNERKPGKCVLFTANTSDFSSADDPTRIQEELLKDCDKFIVCNSANSFIKEYGKVLEQPEYKFRQYFERLVIDEPVLNKFIGKFMSIIREHVHQHVDHLSPYQLLKRDYIIDGQVVPFNVELLHCNILDTELYAKRAIVSCVVYVSCEVEILEYNASKDFGEESFRSVDEQDLMYRIYCNFDLEENEVCKNFEISYLQRDSSEGNFYERKYMQNKQLITLLSQYKGQAKHFILKSGDKIPAGIHEIDEDSNTVTFMYGQALAKLKAAQDKGESIQHIINNSNNYTTISISEIESIV